MKYGRNEVKSLAGDIEGHTGGIPRKPKPAECVGKHRAENQVL